MFDVARYTMAERLAKNPDVTEALALSRRCEKGKPLAHIAVEHLVHRIHGARLPTPGICVAHQAMAAMKAMIQASFISIHPRITIRVLAAVGPESNVAASILNDAQISASRSAGVNGRPVVDRHTVGPIESWTPPEPRDAFKREAYGKHRADRGNHGEIESIMADKRAHSWCSLESGW